MSKINQQYHLGEITITLFKRQFTLSKQARYKQLVMLASHIPREK